LIFNLLKKRKKFHVFMWDICMLTGEGET
jgi:hypothetical protein